MSSTIKKKAQAIADKQQQHITNGTRIYIKYDQDLNLPDLHNRLVRWYQEQKPKRLEIYQRQLQKLVERVTKPQVINKRVLDLKRIDETEVAIKRWEEDILLNSYIKEIEPILERYKELGTLNKRNVFGADSATEDKPKSELRSEIISLYLNRSKTYFPLEIEKKLRVNTDCPECGINLADVVSDTSEVICPGCGLVNQTFKNVQTVGETSDYEDKENFIKAVYRYQGKEKITLDSNLFSALDDFFRERTLPISEEVREMPKKNGRRGPPDIIGKKILRKALKAKGYKHYYDNVNLICHEYWDWDLPDISHLEETLFNDYDKTEKVLKRIKGPDRKATINTSLRLKFHLLARGHPVKVDDFKIVGGRTILEMYDRWWKIMCAECGDKDIKYVKII